MGQGDLCVTLPLSKMSHMRELGLGTQVLEKMINKSFGPFSHWSVEQVDAPSTSGYPLARTYSTCAYVMATGICIQIYSVVLDGCQKFIG